LERYNKICDPYRCKSCRTGNLDLKAMDVRSGGYSYQYHASTLQPETAALIPSGVTRILDLGGGRGGNGLKVKTISGERFVCCADSSEIALGDAVEGVDATALCNIEALGSIETVFDKHGPFDLILCLDVLEHLVDPWRQVARLHGLMPIGGY